MAQSKQAAVASIIRKHIKTLYPALKAQVKSSIDSGATYVDVYLENATAAQRLIITEFVESHGTYKGSTMADYAIEANTKPSMVKYASLHCTWTPDVYQHCHSFLRATYIDQGVEGAEAVPESYNSESNYCILGTFTTDFVYQALIGTLCGFEFWAYYEAVNERLTAAEVEVMIAAL